MEQIISILAQELGKKREHIENVVNLLDEGNTIPFIARYRKELHGSMDDSTLRNLETRLTYLRNLSQRKDEVIKAITSQEKMTDELEQAILAAVTLAEVEDLYRPYKQKRRTRATAAKEKGLEPLADAIFLQDGRDPEELAKDYIDPEKGVQTLEEAMAGASDIIAERISDDPNIRKALREKMERRAVITVSATDPENDSVYRLYYEFSATVSRLQNHQILAINRGEKEGFLKVNVDVSETAACELLEKMFITKKSVTDDIFTEAITDSYKRLIFPSLEREIRSDLTQNANEQAIKIFGLNLKALLMQPPIKGKVTLGLDPAYRTGCKIAVVDATGKVLDTTVIYPTPPQKKIEEAKQILKALIKKHNVDVISIGNGTASKESEIFVAELIGEIDENVSYMVVNEAGASVYSASKLGAKEFPDYDVSLRSAISIARRLQDPLAELVKIDPKSVGVGQYQHDMPPKQLDETLCGVVEDCVNKVGVDLNTASAPLLSYVSGLSAAVAQNVVLYREQNGAFESREQLKKVSKLGPKAYEQCAGFLRIPGAKNILDNTGVHPESYKAAQKLLDLFDFKKSDAQNGKVTCLTEKIKEMGASEVAQKCGIGVPTLNDIASELTKPGRDLRDDLPAPMLRTDVMDMKDLTAGMHMKGTVRNVIDFGVFVDIGVHQDGLVHISQITNRYIKHPSQVLKVGDVVDVYVISVDVEKKRISLTMKKPE